MKQKLERIISRLYVDGVYKGNSARTITIYGEEHKLDAIAKEVGIELPDAKKGKKVVNTVEDIQEQEHADMERPHSDGDS
jgi:hypothetical protein